MNIMQQPLRAKKLLSEVHTPGGRDNPHNLASHRGLAPQPLTNRELAFLFKPMPRLHQRSGHLSCFDYDRGLTKADMVALRPKKLSVGIHIPTESPRS
jgi:hypothetical protein